MTSKWSVDFSIPFGKKNEVSLFSYLDESSYIFCLLNQSLGGVLAIK